MVMAQQPALIGGVMIGAAAWLVVWAIFFLTPVIWQIAVIPGLFFIAGLFLAGTVKEGAHAAEFAIGGICIAVAIGFVGWFYILDPALLWGVLVSLGSGFLILLDLVFVMGGSSKGY